MTAALMVLAVVIGLGVTVWVLAFGVLLFVDYERGMRMLGGLAMFVRSIRKKPAKDQPHRHQRADDDGEPREHRRRSPSPPTIREFAVLPMPQRRRSDPKPDEAPDDAET